jgi:hypothetical protein
MEEAVSFLYNWKGSGTILRLCFPRFGDGREVQTTEIRQATVTSIKDGVVEIGTGSDRMKIDLNGAEFNGDRRESARSDYGAYLVCE